jgi:O-antigen/teichoic acid export membrane protein
VAALIQTLAAVALFALSDLTPFRVLILIGATNAITWVITLGFGMRAGLVSWRIDRSVLRSGLRFGMKAQLGIVFVFLLLRVDQVMVQRILGFHDLGIYSLAVTLAELMWLLSDPFAAALLPHQVAATGDDDLRLGYATSRLALLLVATIATIAWVTCPVIIRLAYGTDFNEAVWPFRILLPGIVALSIQRPLAGVLLKRGRPGLVTTFGAGALLINVACNLLLLPSMGVVAASIGSTVAYVFLASAYVATTRRAGITEPRDLVPRRADLNLLARAFRSALARTES